jgi:hypothetical protein
MGTELLRLVGGIESAGPDEESNMHDVGNMSSFASTSISFLLRHIGLQELLAHHR